MIVACATRVLFGRVVCIVPQFADSRRLGGIRRFAKQSFEKYRLGARSNRRLAVSQGERLLIIRTEKGQADVVAGCLPYFSPA